MFYYFYQITNKVNNKIYVGVHKTKSLDDGYMGSGSIIRKAIEKHGLENFEKVILEFFGTSEAMYAKEKEVVDEEFLLREDVYNLRCGGYGGFDYINKDKEFLYKQAKLMTSAFLHKYGNNLSEYMKRLNKLSQSQDAHRKRKATRIKNGTVSTAEYMNTPEVREKIKETYKIIGHQQGEKNSSFGTMWITDGIKPIKIKKITPIPSGYRKGRK